jgi:CRISPR-associated protein Cas2
VSERRTHLLAYDIRAPSRLRRVHKALCEVGFHLQYSVFAVDLDERERERLMERLRRLVDQKADDVRLYLVPTEPRGAWQGTLPGDTLFSVSRAPAATLAARLARQCAAEFGGAGAGSWNEGRTL